MSATDAESVEGYIAAQPEDLRRALRRVRAIIRKAVPRGEETIAYKIPAVKLDGKAMIYFAGWRQHYSLYPGAAVLKVFKGELATHDISKGTIRFALDQPVPAKLIERIARFCAREVAAQIKPGKPAKRAKRSKRSCAA